MEIRVLGGHGGKALGFETTSFLIDSKLLVDAGAAATLTIEEQKAVENILITHIHLDHIQDLAYISDNCFGLKAAPFNVYTHETVKGMIKKHLMNDIIWPDFSVLPSPEKPTIKFNAIGPEKTFKLAGYDITPVHVNHAYDAMGYIIDDGTSAVIFTGDTGPTERIWELALGVKNLKAIFTEVSFPNSLQSVADISDHHTSASISRELKKMPKDVVVVLTHLKPNYRDQVAQEVESLGDRRICVLEKDGQIFNF